MIYSFYNVLVVLRKCEWDEDEIYFVFDELKEHFPQLEFEQVSYCAGVLYLKC